MSNVQYARGSLSPIIYFENSAGELMMPVYETGRVEQARQVWEARYKSAGWEWCEAGTWGEVTRLQKRLVDQEERRRQRMSEVEARRSAPARQLVTDSLRARMVSSSCSPYERDFIRHYLDLREDKRAAYEQRWKEHHDYLWAVEQNSGTKIDDRMPSQVGEFWRQS